VKVSYANGDSVLWWTNTRSPTKAPITLISAPPSRVNLAVALSICLAALMLALLALAVALRAGATGRESIFQAGTG